MFFFDHRSIFFSFLGYPMSYLEFFGTLAGGLAVLLSAKGNIWSWSIGIVNVVLFFFLFYQIQLYPDMFLQVFFFITNLIGWWRWAHPRPGEENRRRELRPSWMESRTLVMLGLLTLAGTGCFGYFGPLKLARVPNLASKALVSVWASALLLVTGKRPSAP